MPYAFGVTRDTVDNEAELFNTFRSFLTGVGKLNSVEAGVGNVGTGMPNNVVVNYEDTSVGQFPDSTYYFDYYEIVCTSATPASFTASFSVTRKAQDGTVRATSTVNAGQQFNALGIRFYMDIGFVAYAYDINPAISDNFTIHLCDTSLDVMAPTTKALPDLSVMAASVATHDGTITLVCTGTTLDAATFSVTSSTLGALTAYTQGTYSDPTDPVMIHIPANGVAYTLGDTFTFYTTANPMKDIASVDCSWSVESAPVAITAITSTNTNRTMTVSGGQLTKVKNLVIGQELTSANFPANTVLVGFDTSTGVLTFSKKANVSGSHNISLGGDGFTATEFNLDRASDGSDHIFRGVGSAGDTAVYMAITRFINVAGDYAWWRLSFTTGFSYLDPILGQAEYLPDSKPALPVTYGASMTYYLFADGNHFKMVIRPTATTRNIPCYGGFFRKFKNPVAYPYPVCVGGASIDSGNATLRQYDASLVNNELTAFWIPSPVTTPGQVGRNTDSQMVVLDKNGDPDFFAGFEHVNNPENANNESSAFSCVWPWGLRGMEKLRFNIDGTIPLTRALLSPAYGELYGVFALPAFAGTLDFVSVPRTETMIVDVASSKKYITFNNFGRETNVGQYSAWEMV
jgi:hypothetical protein